jgi:hypothetical protein
MSAQLRIYSPAIVLLVWSVVWTCGYQSTYVVVGFLVATAISVAMHTMALIHAYHLKHPRKDHLVR